MHEVFIVCCFDENIFKGENSPNHVVRLTTGVLFKLTPISHGNHEGQLTPYSYLPPPQGGTHVNYVVDQVVSKLLEAAKKKNKGGMDLKPLHIKGHLWVFVNCLIENPSFDSQTKENMTLKVKSFGSACNLSEKLIKQVRV